MNFFLIFMLLIILPVCAMQDVARTNIQLNWNQLPRELWLEIAKFAIGDGQTQSDRLKNCMRLLCTDKQFNQLMQSDSIQNSIKKHVYAETQDLWSKRKNIKTMLPEFAIEKDKFGYIYFYIKDNTDKLNDEVNSDGDTLLHLAIRHGNHRIFNFLLTKNPDVNKQTKWREETPLHEAIEQFVYWGKHRKDNLFALKLKDKNANLYIKNTLGLSPLEVLAIENRWNFINELIPQEHKDALNIKSISDHSQLLQLHAAFGPEEQKTKKARLTY